MTAAAFVKNIKASIYLIKWGMGKISMFLQGGAGSMIERNEVCQLFGAKYKHHLTTPGSGGIRGNGDAYRLKNVEK